jgi:hypothetical protein
MSLYVPLPPAFDGSLPRVSAAERLLLDAARRLARQPSPPRGGWTALVLHLSGLRPPAPRPHHRRVARALLEEAARPHDGQVFPMRNGDLVLLCRSAGLAGQALAGRIVRLLQADSADLEHLVSLWTLPAGSAALQAYAAARLADAPVSPPRAADASAALRGIDAMAALAAGPRGTGLLRRQTGISFPRAGAAFRQAHRSIGFARDALAAAAGLALPEIDPFLLRHLATRLDRLLLARLLLDHLPRDAVPTHADVSLATILAPDFSVVSSGLRLGAEVALLDAAADPEGFSDARGVLADAGHALILGGITPAALRLADAAALAPDWLKLDWAETLADPQGPAAWAVERLLARWDPAAIVLNRADSEASLRWGMARGIRRFQGRHVEAMLAASRLAACHAAPGCTLGQCRERAAAGSPAGQRGCTNPALLAAAMP